MKENKKIFIRSLVKIAIVVLACIVAYFNKLDNEDGGKVLFSIALVIAIIVSLELIKELYLTFKPSAVKKKKLDVKILTQAALCATLAYIAFTTLKIEFTFPGGMTAIHFGNVFCVLAALLIGGYWGGLAGAIGLSIADLTSAYAMYTPTTFLLKLLIGLVVGLIAHNIAKISKHHKRTYIVVWTILASIAGMAFNTIASPLVNYLYLTYLVGIPQDLTANLAKIATAVSGVNALTTVVISSTLYLTLRPILVKANMLIRLSEDEKANV